MAPSHPATPEIPRAQRFVVWVAAGILLAGCGIAFTVKNGRSSARPSPKPHAVDTAGFARGACVVYPPIARDRHQIVFLDPGHGGREPGVVVRTQSGQSVEEANLTLKVTLDTLGLLRSSGFTVVLSRTGAGSVARLGPPGVAGGGVASQETHDDLAARARCANRAKANVLVGIYFDAGGSGQSAGSVTTYDATRTFAQRDLQLAELLQGDVLDYLSAPGRHIPDNGVVQDSVFVGSARDATSANAPLILLGPAATDPTHPSSAMPGAVIEPLSLTDPFEASLAASPSVQRFIAVAIATAVSQFLPRRAGSAPALLSPSVPGQTLFAEDLVDSVPLVDVWSVPPAGVGQGPITVAAFDPARTELVLHAGSIQPGSNGPWLNGPEVGAPARFTSCPRSTLGSRWPTPEADGSQKVKLSFRSWRARPASSSTLTAGRT